MNEIITIDGVKYKRIEEENQPAEEPKKSVFECEFGDKYYVASYSGGINEYHWKNNPIDNVFSKVANCCKDKKLMEQRALHEVLDRLLWRASVEAGELDNEWSNDLYSHHYHIYYDKKLGTLKINSSYICQLQGVCYFPTEESAQAAIDNIIKPFMKAHPEFVW